LSRGFEKKLKNYKGAGEKKKDLHRDTEREEGFARRHGRSLWFDDYVLTWDFV